MGGVFELQSSRRGRRSMDRNNSGQLPGKSRCRITSDGTGHGRQRRTLWHNHERRTRFCGEPCFFNGRRQRCRAGHGRSRSFTASLMEATARIQFQTLVFDKSGNLYGTTSAGTGNGVFQLTPPTVSGGTSGLSWILIFSGVSARARRV